MGMTALRKHKYASDRERRQEESARAELFKVRREIARLEERRSELEKQLADGRR